MGKLIIGIVIGLVVGAVGAFSFGGGAAMGLGVATGLSAGACSVLKGAQAENLITAEQADQILNRVNTEMKLAQSGKISSDHQKAKRTSTSRCCSVGMSPACMISHPLARHSFQSGMTPSR